MRFLIVVHGWFVDSKGFDVHEVDAENIDEAYENGVILAHDRASTFDKCAFKCIAIEDGEVFAGRRLSISERLIGRINTTQQHKRGDSDEKKRLTACDPYR